MVLGAVELASNTGTRTSRGRCETECDLNRPCEWGRPSGVGVERVRVGFEVESARVREGLSDAAAISSHHSGSDAAFGRPWSAE